MGVGGKEGGRMLSGLERTKRVPRSGAANRTIV